ncbi:trypsin-1-like [Uloborus diversus]|uniref:trypsin-1-like n=1 Tax=Uloborus diversus TaxID=327109 RepID=UPI0024096E5D|nr:trypsin-1-like [Uloborus diversus]
MLWMGRLLVFLTVTRISIAQCGNGLKSDLEDKIVGGRKAVQGEFPWQASLQRRYPSGFYHICGATLVTSEWLVTAAHCITLSSVKMYRVLMGSNNLTTLNGSLKSLHFVKTIVIKQGFDPETFHNDIALLQIFPKAATSDFICLQDTPPDVNISAIVLGWGATTDGGSASNELQVAEVALIPRGECLEYYHDLLLESMICAGYSEGGIDACQGDSGGPLMQWRKKTAYLIGVVSWGIGCAEPLHPGVYTDVSLFANWIRYYTSP